MRVNADTKPDNPPPGYRQIELYEKIRPNDLVWWNRDGDGYFSWTYLSNSDYYGLTLQEGKKKLDVSYSGVELFVASKEEEDKPIFNKRILSKTMIRKMIKL